MQIRIQLQPATKEEKKIATEILRRTDHPGYQCLTHDAAILHLFPKLDLRSVVRKDGSTSSPLDTFEAAWQVILWLKIQEKGSRTTNRLRHDRVEQLVRLLGHVQTGEVIAGVEPEDILNSRLMTPGPLCRIYGWTFRPGEEVFDKPSIDEHELMFAIMVQGGQYCDGNAWLDKTPAWEFLRRSGLDNDTLALIWDLADWRGCKRLARKDVVRMVRLISCAQRGLRLHARLFENCQPISRHFDCLLSPVLRPAIPLSSSPTSPTTPVSPSIPPPSLPAPFPIPQLPRATPSSSILQPSTPPPPPPIPQPSKSTPPAPVVTASPNRPSSMVPQPHQRLFGSQLHPTMHAQILDIGNADHSGSVSHAEMIDVFAQFISELRLDIPGRGRQFRQEAIRVDRPHGEDVHPTLVDTVAILADWDGSGDLDSMSAPMQSLLPRGPPPWVLNVDHCYVTPSQQEALQRNDSTTEPARDSRLRNPSNQPVSPAPQLAPSNSEVLQTSPRGIDRNHGHCQTSLGLLSVKDLPPPPYELEDNRPQTPPQSIQCGQIAQIHRPIANEHYRQSLTPQYRDRTEHYDASSPHVKVSHSHHTPQPQQSRDVSPSFRPATPASHSPIYL